MAALSSGRELNLPAVESESTDLSCNPRQVYSVQTPLKDGLRRATLNCTGRTKQPIVRNHASAKNGDSAVGSTARYGGYPIRLRQGGSAVGYTSFARSASAERVYSVRAFYRVFDCLSCRRRLLRAEFRAWLLHFDNDVIHHSHGGAAELLLVSGPSGKPPSLGKRPRQAQRRGHICSRGSTSPVSIFLLYGRYRSPLGFPRAVCVTTLR